MLFIFINFFPLAWYACYIPCLPNIRSISNILCRKQNQKNIAKLAIKVRSTCIRLKKGRRWEISMSSCLPGVPHILHSVRVPRHSAHFVSCQEFQPRRQYEDKFAICAVLGIVCPARKYSDWHSVWKWVYPGCRGKKNMPKRRETSNMHIHAFLP